MSFTGPLLWLKQLCGLIDYDIHQGNGSIKFIFILLMEKIYTIVIMQCEEDVMKPHF